MEVFEWQERDDSTPFFIHMIAGSFAGITEHLSMIPIDNVKTHCQAGRSLSIPQIITKIYKAGGLSNFYAGSFAIASGCIPAHALYFSIYQQGKIILDCRPEQDSAKFALIGAFSAMFHDLIMTPTQALKQRLQLARSENPLVRNIGVARSILQKEGIIAFYRSFPINYFMNIPFGSLMVLFNEKLKHMVGAKENDHGFKYYLCGALAGAIASIPTTPLDVVKTKLNTQYCDPVNCDKIAVCNILRADQKKGQQAKESKNNHKLLWQPQERMSTSRPGVRYRNVLEAARVIWREEGLSGFFKGMKMRMMIQSASSGIGWGTYQLVKGLLARPTIH